MSKSVFVGNNPRIRVESIGGDLSIVGWDGNDMLIKGDEDEIRFAQTGEVVSVSSSDDLALRLPRGAALELVSIGGDASVRGMLGGCELKEVHGDLSIRDAGAVAIGTLHGDLSLVAIKGDAYAKEIHGDVSTRDIAGNVTFDMVAEDLDLRNVIGNVHVTNLSGDASITDVDGHITLDSVADDLALRGVRGNIKVNVGEDVVVYLEPNTDSQYDIDAGDDILLVLPKNANATLDMNADEIFVDWQGIDNNDDTHRVVSLGSGAALINLNAGGEIRVSNRSDAGNSADEFGNFAGLNMDWSGFGERISRRVEEATSRAAKKVEEAARRAERHASRHARHAGHPKSGLVVGRWNWDFKPGAPKPPTPPTSPEPPSEPVSEEERMAILKMLSEKKITAQQAEELLNALDGGK